MNDYQLKLETIVDSKQLLDNGQFKILVKHTYKNVSYKLLDLVLEYLQNYPHQISLIPKKLFIKLLSTEEKALHPLVLFLASRHNDIDYNLNMENLSVNKWAYLMSAFYERIPLIICDPVIVMNVKNKIDTYEMLIDSPQWFNDNEDFFTGILSIQFDENEFDKLFTKLQANWSIFKITKAAVSFVDIVAAKCNKKIVFIEFLIAALFSLPPENVDVTWLSKQIIYNLKLLEANCSVQIDDWSVLAMKAIKCGLTGENPEYSFIKVFRKLVKKAKIDKSIVAKSFDLLAGYSQFTNIMINRDSKQPQKEEVLKLIETLIKKEPTLMAVSHVPLFLCSYNASLSITDQILLRILSRYEENSIPMSNYRPYLWGSFAVSHYQVKSHLISKTLNSFPSTTEVLSYVPLKRLKETISCFPIHRMLHVKNQKIIHYNTSNSKDSGNMFDPSFFLPMISSLLSAEAPLSIEKFNRSGCLSMVLACLGSFDDQIRLAAYHVLSLLRSHLFCRRAENMFWDHFISWVAHGIQDLHLKPPPRLSMIQALFLSRMVLAIANHEKSIDLTCSRILLARPAARLNHIPELKTFLTIFTDTGIKEKSLHMRWCFEIIRDGIRAESDWQIVKNMDLLNIFLVVFNSSNAKDKILILKIMEALFRIQPATNGGVGPWALSLLVTISKHVNSFSTEEILAVFSCLKSLSSSSYISIPIIDFWLNLFLKYGNIYDICSEGFVTLDNLVSKYPDAYQQFSKDNLQDIINCGENSKVLSDNEVFKCRSLIEHGINGFEIKEENSYVFLPALVKIISKMYNCE